jgi:hypothetical protein
MGKSFVIMDIRDYLAQLPEVKTASLAKGFLFWAENRIYEVVDVDEGGYSKARMWRQGEATEVALIPDSTLAKRLPLIARGRALPQYHSREDLLINRRPPAFVFPSEQNALGAAYLDVALCGERAGVYVRRHARHAAFEATNGLNVLRRYYFSRTEAGVETDLPDIKHTLDYALIPHQQGPMVWRLLPHWDESPHDLNQTVAIRPITQEQLAELIERAQSEGEDPLSADTTEHVRDEFS